MGVIYIHNFIRNEIVKKIRLWIYVYMAKSVFMLGLVWSEIKQLWDVGLQEYVGDMWNVIDFVTNALYVATVALRIVAFYQVRVWCWLSMTLIIL
jgi:hypothetical protein